MPTPLVIVSYNHDDIDEVARLVQDLESFGINVWWDKVGVGPGDSWREKFEVAVNKFGQRKVSSLVVAGRNGIGELQQEEIDYLKTNKANVDFIPVLLTGGDRKVFNSIGSAGKNVADLSVKNPNRDNVWEQLLEKLLQEQFVSLMRRLAILQPVEIIPRSCFLSISNPLARGEWEDFNQLLRKKGFNLLEDTNPLPDAFTAEARNTIRSASVVVLDGRIIANQNNIAADVAYAFGIARSYYKPIILLVDIGNTLIDRESIFRIVECDELTPEFNIEIVGAVEEAYQKLCSPYLTTGDGDVIALTFSDIHICPRLRADVFWLIKAYESRWKELERISQGLNLLLGGVEIAVSEESSISPSDVMKRIANHFFDTFSTNINNAYEAITLIATQSEQQLVEAQRVINRIQERAGRKQPDAATTASKFLKLFYQTVSRLHDCHQQSVSHSKLSLSNKDDWFMGPKWWQADIKLQLDYINEAREHLEQFFNELMDLMKPIRPEITSDDDRKHTGSKSNFRDASSSSPGAG